MLRLCPKHSRQLANVSYGSLLVFCYWFKSLGEMIYYSEFMLTKLADRLEYSNLKKEYSDFDH